MLENKLKLSCILLLLSLNILAQKINLVGVIVDEQNKKPISYAALGIKGTEEGGITNEKGEYDFLVPDSLLNSEIIITAFGYEEKNVKISDLIQNQTIKLKPNQTLLSEVSIVSKSFKNKTIGKKSRPFLTFAHMFNYENPAGEQGTIFNIPNITILKNYNFHIIPSSKFKEVKLKLNIYGISNKLPDKLLLNQNIIFTVSQVGWCNLDLKPYKIKIKGYKQIAITCQLLKIDELDNIPFSFGISAYTSTNNWILTRNKSQSDWNSKTGILLANCEIDYLNDNSKIEEKVNIEENIEILSQKDKDLIEIYDNKEKAVQSLYGNNEKAGRFVYLKDAKIYYEIYGTGNPLVLLHGNEGQISDFYRQIPELCKKFQVIAIDTRGQGKSLDFSTGKLKYERFVEDLKIILDSLKLKKVNILGWSDGGNTALMMSYLHPEYVNKFIIVGANLYPTGVDDTLLHSLKEQVNELDSKKDNTSIHSRLLHLMVEEPNISLFDLKKINSLGLVIVGDRDIIKSDHTKLIAGSIANSQLKIIGDASHFVPQEKPEIFNEIVLTFLGN